MLSERASEHERGGWGGQTKGGELGRGGEVGAGPHAPSPQVLCLARCAAHRRPGRPSCRPPSPGPLVGQVERDRHEAVAAKKERGREGGRESEREREREREREGGTRREGGCSRCARGARHLPLGPPAPAPGRPGLGRPGLTCVTAMIRPSPARPGPAGCLLQSLGFAPGCGGPAACRVLGAWDLAGWVAPVADSEAGT